MKRQTFNEINITPLTDIFLVLLIIMMVIAPILDHQGLSLAVPQYVEDTNQIDENKTLTVQVTQDNKFMIDDVEIANDDLLSTLKEKSSEYKNGLLIEASGNSSHQTVVKLMDNARTAGISSVSIVEI